MGMLRNYPFDWLLFVLVGLGLVISLPLTLYRLSGGEIQWYLNGTLLALGAIAIVRLFQQLKQLLSNSVSNVTLIAVQSLFVLHVFLLGWVINGFADSARGLKYYLLGLTMAVALIHREPILEFLSSSKLWKAVLVVHIFSYGYYAIFLEGSIYPGIGVQSLGYAAIYFFSKGSLLSSALAFVLIALEGKRSVMFSTLVALAVLIAMGNASREVRGRLLIAIATLCIVVLGALWVLSFVSGSAIVNRINYINPFAEAFELFMGSSGRLGEILSFFGAMDWKSALVGQGSGFAYVWDSGFETEQNYEVKGYFHLSPLNYLASGGGVGLIVWIYLVWILFDLRKSEGGFAQFRIVAGFLTLSLIQSLFGFNAGTDPFFWVTVIAALKLRRRRTHS